jgi:hypothetical protein
MNAPTTPSMISEIKNWLINDPDRIWMQVIDKENVFRSNKAHELIVEKDTITIRRKTAVSTKSTEHPLPKTRAELFQLFKVKKRKSKKNDSPDVTKSISDEFGNLLISRNNGKRVLLTLRLASTNETRRIGTINLATKTIDMERTRAIHLFRKTNSYGFNHELLKKSILFDKVRLRDDFQEWLIPKDFILQNGSFLNFKNHGGFELQIFLPLNMMEEFKREPKI